MLGCVSVGGGGGGMDAVACPWVKSRRTGSLATGDCIIVRGSRLGTALLHVNKMLLNPYTHHTL